MGMGYKIALLDDDPNDIDIMSNALKKYIEYDIYGFTSIEELIKSNPQIDVLFLDVEMPQMSGIHLAERIKELKSIPIVFMSWHEGYVFDTFKIHPLYFIRKSELQMDLPKCMREIHLVLSESRVFEFVSHYQKYSLKVNEIMYVQIKERKTIIHMVHQETFDCRIPLNKIQNEIGFEDFILLNKETLVNMMYIEILDDFSCILKNKECLDISYRKRKSVENDYHEYKKRGVRR